LNFNIWKPVFTNVRFRSWSSKPLSVNAALVINLEQLRLKILKTLRTASHVKNV